MNEGGTSSDRHCRRWMFEKFTIFHVFTFSQHNCKMFPFADFNYAIKNCIVQLMETKQRTSENQERTSENMQLINVTI